MRIRNGLTAFNTVTLIIARGRLTVVPGPAQNRLMARRRFPAVPMLTSVKLNRSTLSFRTEPSSYFWYSTLSPQQFQLYEVCSAPYWTSPALDVNWFRSSPTFAATENPGFTGEPYPSNRRNWLKFDTAELTPSV